MVPTNPRWSRELSSLSSITHGIPGLRDYGPNKTGLKESSLPKICVRQRRCPRSSDSSPFIVSTKSRSQRCRLQDLCKEDRAKLANLVLELAAAQEAVSHQNLITNLGNPKPTETSQMNHNSDLKPSNSNQFDSNKSNVPSSKNESVQEIEKRTHIEDLHLRYNAQLVQLEQEVQRLRILVTERNCSTPQSSSMTTESGMVQNLNVSTKPVTQSRFQINHDQTSISKHSRSLLESQSSRTAEIQVDSDGQALCQKLLLDRELLQRQRQVLHVVADQQAQLERLELDVRHMAQLIAHELQRDSVTQLVSCLGFVQLIASRPSCRGHHRQTIFFTSVYSDVNYCPELDNRLKDGD
ncbi:unnamed protein product [Echinostoma caproni]|uniref:CCDC92 domain-containing protein n=1 Tax=Echinostoma caproni TaxID=27848 RepID=A0A183AIL4_9TREM|nr:unnamed protein product [Echinostoma caproni]